MTTRKASIGPKEQACRAHIVSAIEEIRIICTAHKISMVAAFALEDDLLFSSALLWKDAPHCIAQSAWILCNGNPEAQDELLIKRTASG